MSDQLVRVQRDFVVTLKRHVQTFLDCERGSPTRQNKLLADMSIVLVHDSWARFCRTSVVVSAACKPFTLSGVKLPKAPGVTTSASVVPVLMATYRRRRYEPRWADATECIDAASRLQIANRTTLAGAIGASGSPADSIRILRNFLVHRNRETALGVRSAFGIPSGRVDSISVAGQFVPGGIQLIEQWQNWLENASVAAIR